MNLASISKKIDIFHNIFYCFSEMFQRTEMLLCEFEFRFGLLHNTARGLQLSIIAVIGSSVDRFNNSHIF